MKPIKIYGESKSGTTYLQKLLELNTDAEILGGSAWEPLGWKHGFPQSGDALYIFLFRDIYEWCKSLIAGQVDKRFNGLQSEFGGTENDFWNVWQNPIECRTAKYYSYLGFAKLNNSILVSLDQLKVNPYPVIEKSYVNYGYDFVPVSDFKDIESHTYIDTEGRDNPKRRELTEQEIAFIDSQKDDTLEQYVNQLTIE